ncbi:MAG: hypothetical protein J7647_01630 [Cyanobacteria bacterium SBLK]|nr:hypothetical protein [Cyanobacteria bacterium SBLK]
MPSPDVRTDDWGNWYQLGVVKVKKGEWRKASYPTIGTTLRFTVSGIVTPKQLRCFIYVALRYQEPNWQGGQVWERSERYYPDMPPQSTLISINPGFFLSPALPWQIQKMEKWVELKVIPRDAVNPNFSILVEELIV